LDFGCGIYAAVNGSKISRKRHCAMVALAENTDGFSILELLQEFLKRIAV
jgi:hypothetical protein